MKILEFMISGLFFLKNHPLSDVIKAHQYFWKIWKKNEILFLFSPRKTKKSWNFMKFQKIFNLKVSNVTIFFSFLASVSFTVLVSFGFRNTNFQNFFLLELNVLWSAHWGCAEKKEIVLIFLDVSTKLSPKKQGSILSSRSHSRPISFYTIFSIKNLWFRSFCYNLDELVMRNKVSWVWQNQGLQNFVQTTTMRLISTAKSSIETFQLVA